MQILLSVDNSQSVLDITSVSSCNHGQLVIRPTTYCDLILIDGVNDTTMLLKHLTKYGYLDLSEYSAYYYNETMSDYSETDDNARELNLCDFVSEAEFELC